MEGQRSSRDGCMVARTSRLTGVSGDVRERVDNRAVHEVAFGSVRLSDIAGRDVDPVAKDRDRVAAPGVVEHVEAAAGRRAVSGDAVPTDALLNDSEGVRVV